jgi:hypothetical protein
VNCRSWRECVVPVAVTRDEEQFLLEADVAHSTPDVKFHKAKELLALVRHCGGGTRKRGLLEGPGGRSWILATKRAGIKG